MVPLSLPLPHKYTDTFLQTFSLYIAEELLSQNLVADSSTKKYNLTYFLFSLFTFAFGYLVFSLCHSTKINCIYTCKDNRKHYFSLCSNLGYTRFIDKTQSISHSPFGWVLIQNLQFKYLHGRKLNLLGG